METEIDEKKITAIAMAADLAAKTTRLRELAEADEELTPEMIADTLEGLEYPLGEKLDAIMSLSRRQEGEAEICDKEIKRLQGHKKTHENQSKNLKKYALSCLIAAEKDSLKTATNTFSVKKARLKLIIDNLNKIPDEYIDSFTQVINTPKADEIEKALGNGIDVPGARMQAGERSLAVR